jgi:predicted nucleotidyltransferase component of viral defense system
MNLSVPDYRKLYRIQDEVFYLLEGKLEDFYLTGGTALGRFYLNHRFSDDLDFFINDASNFQEQTQRLHKILSENFTLIKEMTLDTPSFYRIWIKGEVNLKVEFVNDVKFHAGQLNQVEKIRIDNPCNILSNKLTAILSRDEAKDVFDIVMISQNYSFNWKSVYFDALEKQLVNEATIAWRLSTFPVDLLSDVVWAKDEINKADFEAKLKILADDFLFARDNSLGINKADISNAKPTFISEL